MGINFRILRAWVSRFLIWRVNRQTPLPQSLRETGMRTSDSTDAGGRGASCNLVHSKQSFSFNTRRRSGMERSRAASNGMVAAEKQLIDDR